MAGLWAVYQGCGRKEQSGVKANCGAVSARRVQQRCRPIPTRPRKGPSGGVASNSNAEICGASRRWPWRASTESASARPSRRSARSVWTCQPFPPPSPSAAGCASRPARQFRAARLCRRRRPTGRGCTAHGRRLAKALRRAFGAAFRRYARRKGYSVAVLSLARKLAVLICRMPRYRQDYLNCGEAECEARFQRQRLAGITAAANSLRFELVARDATPAWRSALLSPFPQRRVIARLRLFQVSPRPAGSELGCTFWEGVARPRRILRLVRMLCVLIRESMRRPLETRHAMPVAALHATGTEP